jgi:glycosyltransferase involved in cell wall biosynthesis
MTTGERTAPSGLTPAARPRISDVAPEVAVITAAYDMEAFVAATIASVRAQTLQAFEMIVVDDGSKDRTAEVVIGIGDPRVRLISIPNSGVSAARNRGLAACTAPLLVFLDADDLLTPDALARMVATLKARPEAVACFGHHVRIDEHGAPVDGDRPSALKRLPERDTLRHLIAKNVIVNGGALCIRTAAARRVGGYDPRLRFSEDWEFWCRLAALGDFVALPDLIAVQYRVRFSSANTTLAGTPFHPNLEAIDRIFEAPAVRARFSARELARLRRLAESNVHWSAARNTLSERRLWRFAAYLLAGALRYPESLLQWRLAYLFLRSLLLARHRTSRAQRWQAG